MTWLLKLYPPGWRRRYGQELGELMAAQPFSIGTAIDVIAGAIDAWINPQTSAATSTAQDSNGEATMLAKTMQLRCAGYGPKITTGDALKGAGVMLGGTLALLVVVWWARRQLGDHPYIESLLPMAFFLPLLLGLRYTSLKGRSAAVQWIFIGGLGVIVVAMLLLATWAAERL
jgi:hypothetical protein